jgi:hypothetical protein
MITKEYLSIRESVLIRENGQVKHFKECNSFDEAKKLVEKLNKKEKTLNK